MSFAMCLYAKSCGNATIHLLIPYLKSFFIHNISSISSHVKQILFSTKTKKMLTFKIDGSLCTYVLKSRHVRFTVITSSVGLIDP